VVIGIKELRSKITLGRKPVETEYGGTCWNPLTHEDHESQASLSEKHKRKSVRSGRNLIHAYTQLSAEWPWLFLWLQTVLASWSFGAPTFCIRICLVSLVFKRTWQLLLSCLIFLMGYVGRWVLPHCVGSTPNIQETPWLLTSCFIDHIRGDGLYITELPRESSQHVNMCFPHHWKSQHRTRSTYRSRDVVPANFTEA
jgi:hypothetical protein